MNFQIRIYLCAAALILFSGCAKRPDAIAPVSIPMAAYEPYDCNELSMQLLAERETYVALEKSQKNAATGDAIGVFLLGIPTASLVGADKEGQIATSKGKMSAMEMAMVSKKCQAIAPPVVNQSKPVSKKSVVKEDRS